MSGERTMLDIPSNVETPAFVVDLGLLEENLQILDEVQKSAGCTILLALKGFAMWSQAPLIRKYLSGVSASSVNEARLGKEEFQGQVHAYAPAYNDLDFAEIIACSDHVILNSFSQWKRLRPLVNRGTNTQFGIRLNPEHSEVKIPVYDPCASGSRLGATRHAFEKADFEGLSGLHFHSLCEHGADALERTLAVIEKNFAPWLEQVSWVNMGGGHHITRPGYGRDKLIKLVRSFKKRWNVEVFLEPGEAIAIHTGVLVSSVLDIFRNNDISIAIIDTSATAHMPDTLEMPYRPDIVGAGQPGEKVNTYRLGGLTCLAGDIIGNYSFDEPLQVGQKIVFLDMSHYTMVKTSNFNGVRLPSICSHEPSTGKITVHRRFDYESYRDRLS